jgi:hypothetical protein
MREENKLVTSEWLKGKQEKGVMDEDFKETTAPLYITSLKYNL